MIITSFHRDYIIYALFLYCLKEGKFRFFRGVILVLRPSPPYRRQLNNERILPASTTERERNLTRHTQVRLTEAPQREHNLRKRTTILNTYSTTSTDHHPPTRHTTPPSSTSKHAITYNNRVQRHPQYPKHAHKTQSIHTYPPTTKTPFTSTYAYGAAASDDDAS